jgi:hypothetical protein
VIARAARAGGAGTVAAAVAIVAAAAAAGFLLGRASALGQPLESGPGAAGREGGAARPVAPARAIAAELVEVELPRSERDAPVVWRGVAAWLEQAFERHGLGFGPEDGAAALAKLRAAGAPEEVAALLDLRAAAEHAAGRREEGGALTRLARELDPDPTRDSIRAPLLSNDGEAVRVVAADLDASKLPLRTATLLGAALLRVGDAQDALDVWRTASVEHPGDLALRLVLGWRLLAAEPPLSAEARRHLEAGRALLPESAAVKARLEAVGD